MSLGITSLHVELNAVTRKICLRASAMTLILLPAHSRSPARTYAARLDASRATLRLLWFARAADLTHVL